MEHSSLDSVTAAVGDPEKCVVIQHSPAVVLAVAEEFGLKPGMDVPGLLNAALRRIGFRKVFNSAFAADIAIQEQSKELVERLKSGANRPLIAACSSAVPFIEEFYPEFIPNLSTVRSAQGILASLIRTRFAKAEGIPPDRIFCVAAAPCTARKSEAAHAVPGGEAALDAVLTSRELLRLIRLYGIDFNSLIPEPLRLLCAARLANWRMFRAGRRKRFSAQRTVCFRDAN